MVEQKVTKTEKTTKNGKTFDGWVITFTTITSTVFIRSNFRVVQKGRCAINSISQRWHHGYQNFGSYALWKPEKCTFQDFLLPQIIHRISDLALSSQELSCRTSTALFSWFKNYNRYWFSNSLLALLSQVPKQQMLLLTRIYCSWWRWWPRATYASNFVTSSQDFHTESVKGLIYLKN